MPLSPTEKHHLSLVFCTSQIRAIASSEFLVIEQGGVVCCVAQFVWQRETHRGTSNFYEYFILFFSLSTFVTQNFGFDNVAQP